MNKSRQIKTVASFRSFSNSIATDPEINAKHGQDEILNLHKQKETLIGKFAKLRYGDDLELIFNTDCQVQNLIDYFRKYCRPTIRDGQIIDLVNQNGELMNLRENLSEICSNLLQARQTFVLVEIKTLEYGIHKTDKIQLLLYNSELLTKELLVNVSEYTKNRLKKVAVKNLPNVSKKKRRGNLNEESKKKRRGTLI